MGSSLKPDSQAGTPVSPALHDQVAGEPFLLCAEALGVQGGEVPAPRGSPCPGGAALERESQGEGRGDPMSAELGREKGGRNPDMDEPPRLPVW